ncbi:TrmB family transcriptional regulator [Pontibacillus litoralis]|uniref:TrmB family transcriptional regulator n=1 Tax=Pontibacillus litoralis JSM 072002 TaxID=1385512 RepID=A0A0A5HSJ2_9BACI|nr:TrmB family transcriptional regulator [Pontibacillus litoralis]KGX86592.1 TrmB family transcriptional regulator [Pontibacillus litoralis JSM 072002]
MLQQFGFTQYESKVYQALITVKAPLDASTIVKHSEVPRAKVYEVLQRMSEKGMILESTVQNKRLYTALPLESVIEKLRAKFEENVERLRETKAQKTPLDDRVWSLKDNQSIQVLIKNMIQQATTSITISGWSDDLWQYIPDLEAKEENGVTVAIHSIGTLDTTISSLSTLIPDPQHETLERSRIIITDETEMLFAGMEQTQWHAIQTRSRPLVKFFTEFFYHDVALTEITRKHKDTILADEYIRDVLLKLRY